MADVNRHIEYEAEEDDDMGDMPAAQKRPREDDDDDEEDDDDGFVKGELKYPIVIKYVTSSRSNT